MADKVSIIVPVYNVEAYLQRCINSLLAQSYEETEIILVDDGSTDTSGEICDKYASHPKVKVIHKENGGLSDARNVGIDVATGSYLTFVDSDDYVAEKMIERMVAVAEESHCDMVQCGFVRGIEEEFSFSCGGGVLFFDNHSAFESRIVKIIACCKLYRRALFEELRYPVGKIHEDEFTTYKAIYASTRIGVMEDALYYYYQSPNSIMRNGKKVSTHVLEAMDERVAYFETRKEERLTEIARKERLLRLIIMCARSEQIKDAGAVKQYETLFRESYKAVIKYSMPFKEKVLLRLFYYCPRPIEKLLNK